MSEQTNLVKQLVDICAAACARAGHAPTPSEIAHMACDMWVQVVTGLQKQTEPARGPITIDWGPLYRDPKAGP